MIDESSEHSEAKSSPTLSVSEACRAAPENPGEGTPQGGKIPATPAKYSQDAIKILPRVEVSDLDVVTWGEGKSRRRWSRPAAWHALRAKRKKQARGYVRRTHVCLAAERISKQEFVRQAKAAPCTDCGNKFHHAAMDFDHVRGEKKFMLSKARKESNKAILEELAKCDLVCSNCHRVRTFKRNQKQSHA